MLREGYFGDEIHAKYSINYLITVNITLSFLGLSLIPKIKNLIILE